MKKTAIILALLISVLPLAIAQETAEQQNTENANEPLRYETGSFLHFGFGGGLGQLGYSLQGGHTTTFMPSFTTDIHYTYYFLPWLGLGTGVHLSYYTSQANLTDQMTWAGQTDSEGDEYTHRVDFDNWRERQHDIMLEIPLALSFKVKPNKGGFYFNVGAKAGIPIYASYIHNRGDLIHSGYYPKWDVVLEQLPGRFETEPLLRADEGSIYNKVRKINAAAFAELGALIQLDPQTDLTLGVYANYYINNHSAVKTADATDLGFRNPEYHTDFMNPYEGLVGTKHIGAMHPWSVGLKIGIQAHLRTKAEKQAAKAKKAAQQLASKTDTIYLSDTLLMTDTIYLPSGQNKVDTIYIQNPLFKTDTIRIYQTRVVHDTIFIRDTLYMTVQDSPIGKTVRKDTTWIVRIDTICPDPLHPGRYINITEDRLRREEEKQEKEAEEQQKQGKPQTVVITEQGKHAAKKLDGKLTTSVIWFHFDDYKPILEPFDVIDTVAQALLADPDLHVNINGHACKIGKDSYNQRLAMKRAQAVARLLRLKGVPAKQMTVRSLGANEPYRYNEEKHQYSKDRRVEIVPLGADEKDTKPSKNNNTVQKQTTQTTVKQPSNNRQTTSNNRQTTSNNAKQPSNNHQTTIIEQDVNIAPQKHRTDIDFLKYEKFIGEEKVKPGSRLAQIARRWYGEQVYWVYIYEANSDKIQNPSLIHPGLTVMIPDLYDINKGLTEEEALEKARELEKIYKSDSHGK